MNFIANSLFSNSASKYLTEALDDEKGKDPKQIEEEEKAKEQLEKEREERKAVISKEVSKREEKRQTLRDKYNIQKKKPEEEKSAMDDGIEVVQEQIEEIKKKSSCKCMWNIYFLSDKERSHNVIHKIAAKNCQSLNSF